MPDRMNGIQTAPDLVVGGVTVPGAERQRCEVWSRVMGYLRPLSMWNAGKQSEWHERKPFRAAEQQALDLAERHIAEHRETFEELAGR